MESASVAIEDVLQWASGQVYMESVRYNRLASIVRPSALQDPSVATFCSHHVQKRLELSIPQYIV